LESHQRALAWGYLAVDPRETLELLKPVADLSGMYNHQHSHLISAAAPSDPALALQLAERTTDPFVQARLFARIAAVRMAQDPAQPEAVLSRALQLAESMEEQHLQDLTYQVIVRELAREDPVRALALVREITAPIIRARMLRTIASEEPNEDSGLPPDVVEQAPAEALAMDDIVSRMDELSRTAMLLASVAPARASDLPSQACLAMAPLRSSLQTFVSAHVLEPCALAGDARALELTQQVPDGEGPIWAMTCVTFAYANHDQEASLRLLRDAAHRAI
jgi:hypothetical protein